jgi:trehalose utilization protein
MSPLNVTIFNEFVHERRNPKVQAIYPDGIHETIGAHLRQLPEVQVQTATQDQPEHGLTQAVLDQTDVLLWWGHLAHEGIDDAVVDQVHERVLDGMGLIVLHSGHHSKIFRRLMGTSCSLTWREANERERLWVVDPSHPISEGLDAYIQLDQAEMYGELFDIPTPEHLIFISWFEGGEVFRSGATWHRGKGKIFYFRPGHEIHPQYHHPDVLRVISNAVRWAAFRGNTAIQGIGPAPEAKHALEPIDGYENP